MRQEICAFSSIFSVKVGWIGVNKMPKAPLRVAGNVAFNRFSVPFNQVKPSIKLSTPQPLISKKDRAGTPKTNLSLGQKSMGSASPSIEKRQVGYNLDMVSISSKSSQIVSI